jgi:hypothetical protein
MENGLKALVLVAACGLSCSANALGYRFDYITGFTGPFEEPEASEFFPSLSLTLDYAYRRPDGRFFKDLGDDEPYSIGEEFAENGVPYAGLEIRGSQDYFVKPCNPSEVLPNAGTCSVAPVWLTGTYEMAFDLAPKGRHLVGYIYWIAEGDYWVLESDGKGVWQFYAWGMDREPFPCGDIADEPCTATGRWVGPSVSVPEPTTLALLSLGIAGLGLSRRRRSH